jgi:hypothetical protein
VIPNSSRLQIGENNSTADQLSLGAEAYGYQFIILEDREENLKAYTLVDNGSRWWGSRFRGPLAPLAIHSDGGYPLVKRGFEYEKTFGMGVAGVQRLGLAMNVGY